ncbi:MAG: pyruvate formate lyase-activating protein [Ruminococcaceae bacterium]|nr:pyruvate formate lyase-activating protein [Oscillospiraceae bacterium]
MAELTCKYSSVQTMGTLDGPGVRFVLFLQGCPLSCGYCHNPETRAFDGGKTATVTEIMAKVSRCRSYFGKKGGITVSGGEPLVQAKFITELFKECRKAGIHTCIDTSGCILSDDIEEMLNYTDLCLLDIKMTNNEDYKKLIGCDMSAPLGFLQKLSEKDVKVWLRQVIVEGINDNEENVKLFNDIAEKYDNVTFTELLPFRKLCESKYKEMNIPFPFEAYPETERAVIEKLSQKLTKRNK